jgi:hypothetical protein
MTTTQLRLTTTTTTRRPAARVSASLRVVCQAAQPARVSRRNVALALPALSGTPSHRPSSSRRACARRFTDGVQP